MNGKLVDWKDANVHIATHVIHYGSAVFEGARCYATPKGSACFRLDAHMRRLQHSAKIYRMDYPLDLAGWNNAVLDTIRANEMKACYIRPIRLPRLRFARRQPAQLPGRRGDPAVGMGRLSRPGSARAGRRRQGLVLVAHGAEHAAGDGQERRQLRELRADQDGSARRRLRRRDRARRLGQHQRRQRPEHLHGPRRRHLHAAARLVDSRRHHPRLGDDAGARSRLHRQRSRSSRARRSTSPTKCSSSAPRPRSRRSARSTSRRSARAGAARSRRRCSRRSSTSSTARSPTRTAGSPTSIRTRVAAAAGAGRRGGGRG